MIFKRYNQGFIGTQARRFVQDGDFAINVPDNVWGDRIIAVCNKAKQVQWQIGRTYPIQSANGEKSGDHIRIIEIKREHLQDISYNDILCEGYPTSPYSRHFDGDSAVYTWFVSWWNSDHKKPGTRFEDAPEVWVLTFRSVQLEERFRSMC